MAHLAIKGLNPSINYNYAIIYINTVTLQLNFFADMIIKLLQP